MIRFYNGKLLTMTDGVQITDGELWTDGSRICHVGPAPERRPVFEREINLQGNLLMPGFKDAHTHSAMTFLRSYADDLPLQTWLFDKVFPMEDKLTPEQVYTMTQIAIMEYLTSGITACFDMYIHPEHYVQANIDTGFRTVLCGGLSDGAKPMEWQEEYFRKFNAIHPRISFRLGFHAEYTIGMERLQYLSDLAHRYHQPVFTHSSETASEVAGCVERHGTTPTVFFDSLGLFDYGGGGFHCTHMCDADLEIMKRRGLWAVTNPASNAKLASGIAPITRMLDEGISLAIGTDGAASNNALDMFREMYLVSVLQKLAQQDAAACDACEVLKMATVGGAHAMGLEDCDVLAIGKQADLIVLDLMRPNMQPIHNIPKNLVYSGSKENVKLTMVAGKILYENGEFFIGAEPGKIYETANRMIAALTE